MKMKKLVSALTAAALAATAITTSQVVFADATFASASDFITDVMNTALADVTSATKANAIATMQGKLTTSGDAVLYDGTTIGYWYSDASTTLYTDDTKTDTLFTKSATGYDVDPALLGTLLGDINGNLVDTYTPTTDDWSKIVGKYDIKLGDITIPAAQWVPLEISSVEEPIENNEVVNISALSGINGNNADAYLCDNNTLYVTAYVIDTSGKLYVKNTIHNFARYTSSQNWFEQKSYAHKLGESDYTNKNACDIVGSSDTRAYVKAGLTLNNNNIIERIYLASAPNNSYSIATASGSASAASDSSYNIFCNILDAGDKYNYDPSTLKESGIIYLTGEQVGANGSIWTFVSMHNVMFDSHSASKQITGNTVLAKRLMKIASLEDTDVLTVASTGWLVNDTETIDEYMASQNMLTAGETAEIDAVAEIAPLSFNVVVPTTLPIYVATDGIVTTASNATVINKSNAAVRITDINITAKPDCDWTLVDDNPSDVRDAKEFTFETSLVVNQVLERNETCPFTYDAKLSPMTEGVDNLDLATVSVTVDWAD